MAHFDYSEPGAGREKLTLIVRPGNRYGDATEGDTVEIDARDYRGMTIKSTLMTAAEAERLRREELDKKAVEDEKRAQPKTVAMVESALAQLTARAREAAAAKAAASPSPGQ